MGYIKVYKKATDRVEHEVAGKKRKYRSSRLGAYLFEIEAGIDESAYRPRAIAIALHSCQTRNHGGMESGSGMTARLLLPHAKQLVVALLEAIREAEREVS
jgi:hypothetical protein